VIQIEEKIDCGNAKTVEMLYLKLGRPALGKTINLVGPNAAEEILQEVFTKLWQKKLVFDNIRMAYAWVYKCCTNGAIDHIRSQKKSTELGDNDGASVIDPNFESNAEAQVLWKQVAKELKADETALFIYRNVEGLSQDEVAEVMQISRRTVNRLQEKLDQKIEKIRRRERVG
jgi:RNA polymerase sigma-70 factor, ECF subfamily